LRFSFVRQDEHFREAVPIAVITETDRLHHYLWAAHQDKGLLTTGSS
jgi:hypothetical protein